MRGRMRRAASSAPRRLTLTLGPVTRFLPDSPVIYLSVGGDLGALHGLRDRVLSGPLERPLSWPFVPHVTLADRADTVAFCAENAPLWVRRSSVRCAPQPRSRPRSAITLRT